MTSAVNQKQRAIVFVSNTLWYLHTFRLRTIEALQQEGYRVICAGQAGPAEGKLRAAGCEVVALNWRLAGMNPIHELGIVWRLITLFLAAKPLLVFSFTIKANLNSSIACRLCRVPYVANVSGLGTAFLHEGLLYVIVRRLFGLANAAAHTVFFQNRSDLELFKQLKLSTGKRVRLIPGSGVDIEKFKYAAPRAHARSFLMVSRLIRDKGVGEYLAAARVLKQRDAQLRFTLVGPAGIQNSTAMSLEAVAEYADAVDYLGEREDIATLMAEADCVVLPSYREGMPKVVLEAASVGRIAVVSNVPGCQDAIVPGETGFFCAARSSEDLAAALERVTKLDENELQRMSHAARKRAEDVYADSKCITPYLEIARETAQHRVSQTAYIASISRALGGGPERAKAMRVLCVRVMSIVLSFLATALLIRWLGPATYGAYALALATITVAAIPIAVGAANVLMRDLARTNAPDRAQLNSSFSGTLRGAALLFALYAACGVGWALSTSNSTQAGIVLCLAFVCLLDMLSGLRAGALRGFQFPVLAQLPDQILRPLTILLITSLLLVTAPQTASLNASLAVMLSGSLVASVAGWVLMRTHAPALAPAKTASGKWIGPSIAVTASTGVLVLGGYIDTYLLAALANAEAVGIYRATYQLALVAGLAYASINLVAAPSFGAYLARKDITAFATTSKALARLAFALTVPALVAAWLWGDLGLALLFGDVFSQGHAALMILVASHALNAIAGFGAATLLVLHREKWIFVGALAGIATNASVAFLLIPELGLAGAAFGSLAGVAASNVVFVAVVVTATKTDPTIVGMRFDRRPPSSSYRGESSVDEPAAN